MKINEVEEWYDGEKEKITQEYLDALEKKQDSKKTELKFHRKFKILHKQYEDEMSRMGELQKVERGLSPATSFFKALVDYFK
jgi:hypothetical protein